MTIGEKIKKMRKQRGLTQKQLAKDAGIAVISLQQYELGKREPTTKQIVKISNAFNVPIDFFITDWESELYNKDMWRTTKDERKEIAEEKYLLQDYHFLNKIGKAEARKRVQELTEIKRYTEKEEPPIDS